MWPGVIAVPAEGGGPYKKNKHNLIDAEFAINEGARGEVLDGKRSARPVPDKAIYQLPQLAAANVNCRVHELVKTLSQGE